MIEKLHISKWNATNTKKDGTALEGKFGPYWRVGITCTEYEGWLSGFISGTNKPEDWTGKEMVLDVTKGEYLGKEQLTFKVPKAEAAVVAEMDGKLEQILNKLVGISLRLETLAERIPAVKTTPKIHGTDIDYPQGNGPTAFDEPVDSIHDSSDEEPPF